MLQHSKKTVKAQIFSPKVGPAMVLLVWNFVPAPITVPPAVSVRRSSRLLGHGGLQWRRVAHDSVGTVAYVVLPPGDAKDLLLIFIIQS